MPTVPTVPLGTVAGTAVITVSWSVDFLRVSSRKGDREKISKK